MADGQSREREIKNDWLSCNGTSAEFFDSTIFRQDDYMICGFGSFFNSPVRKWSCRKRIGERDRFWLVNRSDDGYTFPRVCEHIRADSVDSDSARYDRRHIGSTEWKRPGKSCGIGHTDPAGYRETVYRQTVDQHVRVTGKRR